MTDVVLIGGGHNALVCAAYLARAGRSVTVLEAADRLGGAAVTREFADGFLVPAAAHLLYALDPGVVADLGLEIPLARENLRTVSLGPDGQHLTIDGPRAEGAGISAEDQAAFADHHARMSRFAALLATLNAAPAPRLSRERWADIKALGGLAWRLRRLGREDMREFLRIIGINIFDVLEERLAHPLLTGALALDAVVGNHLGPRSNNSVFNALHRHGERSLPKGGMGSVTDALAAVARSHGVELRTGCEVSEIRVEDGKAVGVTLASGEALDAPIVVSGADPRRTFLDLLGARHLEAGFAARVSHFRSRGNVAKLHLALDGLPAFTGVDESDLGERLIISPDLHALERAFNHAKYGETSAEPMMEIILPSLSDDSLAPAGKHVLSAVVQYAPYALAGGWDAHREAFADRVVARLAEFAPGIDQHIVARELLTPVDLEREFRTTGGHWHHGELTLDQALMLRPVPGAAQYATPVPGLYLCGAGCHPGGGVSGAAGRNAAQAVLGGRP